ncbi:MAG: sodium-dependent transporter [Bacteroidales bacterium]|nr:sodium-dependent transporter [Bacteroidales bacterium]
MAEREKFGTRFGSLMALAGVSIGLGNLWRFPYMVGSNGGAAFVLVYIVIVFLICLPVLTAEILLGRKGRATPLGAFKKLTPGTGWKWAGLWMVITPIVVLSYYCVIGGWGIGYFFKSVCFDFTASSASREGLSEIFGNFSASPWKPIVCQTVFLVLTAAITLAGVKKGIERFGKVMMPLLFVIVILIVVRSATLPHAAEGFKYLFRPDFHAITPSVCVAALGQALFSLSIGHGLMFTYGSYLRDDENIGRSSTYTVVADFFFAILASCAIIPAVFAFGIDPEAGPGLIFETLPFIFTQMPLGGVVAILFFLAVLIAALTSSICFFETGKAFLVEELHLSNRAAAALVFGIAWVIGGLCALSFGPLAGISIFGRNIFNFLDQFTADVLITLGALFLVIYAGWKIPEGEFRSEFTNNGTLTGGTGFYRFTRFVVRYIAPLAILLIFISGFFG